jgi:hypothetical protein
VRDLLLSPLCLRLTFVLPYADCFAAALATARKAALATSDQDFAPFTKRLDIFWTTT